MRYLEFALRSGSSMTEPDKHALRVAFVAGAFPSISHTFIINQVADLLDRGIEVEVFTFGKGSSKNVSSRYEAYHLDERTHDLGAPKSRFRRLTGALLRAFHMLRTSPRLLIRAVNFAKYGKKAYSLRLLFEVAPFVGKRFDVVHCHFGTCAVSFLDIRDILESDVPFITTFYGYDVSSVFEKSPADFYDRLKREGSLFLVMSNNMKRRVVAQGFPEHKVKVHPASIDVRSYPFCERRHRSGEPVEIVSVGRFVEKKGFDDLLRALAIVKRRTDKTFHCSVIGGGPLEEELRRLTSSLGLRDVVDFKGYLKIEDIVELLLKKHIMVQPSKTARDGDME